ncbi:hypothetical protein JET97_14115 [Pseudomonas aeruginosa]|nr:hypothetical protein [Pseudomonas aeruginosa]MBI7032007.1 hypothetical protein [Pseudomonas aeruginosa]MBI7190589.1 hypothetical protein [Pseudomonas aeruginosa]MBI7207809.1 hypothetical protein [Pseudomonas aeruginosa]HCF7645817.1 hypothetical protein [Pseudomonas aeruginosa]
MNDHAELRRLDDSEVEQLLERYIKRFPGEHKAAMSRYFEAVHQELAPLARKLEAERDRLKEENDVLRGALQAVEAEVDGNLRPLTRDLVNMVSGLKNGSHPNDIYEHCDEIERIIGAALKGATQ